MSRFAREPAAENKPQLLMRCALPWSGIPHRQHELACGLAEYFDVIYLEPPTQAKGAARAELDTAPTLGPEFGSGGFLGRPAVARWTTPIPKWFWYLSPYADILRARLAWQALTPQLSPNRAPRILWIDGGSSAPAALSIPHDLLVYDCVDLDWAYSSVAIRRAALKYWHKFLLRKADIVIFSMKSQFDKIQHLRSNCCFIPNACSSAHFKVSVPCPAALQTISRPRIGFVGTMLKRRFDAEIIREAAAKHPQWSFVLIGEADEIFKDLLCPLPNIHFFGRFPHSEMPAFAAHFDVCLIANLVNTGLKHGFPKKLFEYLATGRPVVSTPMPEVLPFIPLVKIAQTPEEYAQKIDECLAENADPVRAAELSTERQFLARENTWEKRAEQIIDILDSELRSRGYPCLREMVRVTP